MIVKAIDDDYIGSYDENDFNFKNYLDNFVPTGNKEERLY